MPPLPPAAEPAPAVGDAEPGLGLVSSPPQPAQIRRPYAAQTAQRRRSRACLCSVERCSRSRMRIAFQKKRFGRLERDPEEACFACSSDAPAICGRAGLTCGKTDAGTRDRRPTLRHMHCVLAAQAIGDARVRNCHPTDRVDNHRNGEAHGVVSSGDRSTRWSRRGHGVRQSRIAGSRRATMASRRQTLTDGGSSRFAS